MVTLLNDQSQRDRALHTTHSFIVHAPAGSGKTELLVQRYLALLSESTSPDAVQAWTFTRKAADEMRQRVLKTLQLAAASSIPAVDGVEKTRFKLGKKLHAWQAAKGWNLLENTHRLHIQTIDAFYAHLTLRASSNVQLPSSYEVVEDPLFLYQVAVQRLLDEIEIGSELSEALSQLLRYLNNDTAQIEQLLIHMLSHRDQWIGIVPQGADDLSRLRFVLEQHVSSIHNTAYQAVETAFLQCGVADWEQRAHALLRACSTVKGRDELTPEAFWSLLSSTLLTKKGEWRKTVSCQQLDHLPVSEQRAFKQSIQYFLNELKDKEAVRIALLSIQRLPLRHYTTTQWSLLSHLFYILKALLSILELVFQHYEQADYIAVALRAHVLLGEADNPTALLLQLDYQIQHILIDEFQDTSRQQLKFLARLVEGWQPDDGRTLFLVGDPMQSIYRFRKAEARLFKWVQLNGVGGVELELLTLSANFRATPSLIRWTNQHFGAMQPGEFEARLFTHATTTRESLLDASEDGVQLHWLANATFDQEVEEVINTLKQVMAERSGSQNLNASIAILGRSRQHLLPILARLREEHIPSQAIDIETLMDKPIIQDLLALTRALSQVADDVAWLAVLRAPWCGMTLSELHCLVQACQQHKPSRLIWSQLQYLHELGLPKTAHIRLDRFLKALAPMVDNYGRVPLSARVMQAWYCLGGPATQPLGSWHPNDLDRFCKCVNELQHSEIIVDHTALERKLTKIYATQPDGIPDDCLHLMTIHKAKGLEFDSVIVPGLNKSTRHQARPLLLFDEELTMDGHAWLVAPIQSSDSTEPDATYRYLRSLDEKQYDAEVLRLLYVACTRAKRQLHLIGSLSIQKGILMTKTDTFLHWLWPVLDHRQQQVKQNLSKKCLDNDPSRVRRMTSSSRYPVVRASVNYESESRNNSR